MQTFFASFEPKDWVTFFIAIWGASLSTYLGYRQLGKDRKRLQIVLDRPDPNGDGRLTLSNSGHRPLTVVEIDFRVQTRNPEGEWWHGYTRHEGIGQITSEQGEDRLPKLLADGERLAIRFPRSVFDLLKDPSFRIFVVIKDGDNKRHTKYKRGENWPKRVYKLPKLVWK